MLTTRLCEFDSQEIVGYIGRSLEEKKLLYFGMENLNFTFIDPVSLLGMCKVKQINIAWTKYTNLSLQKS